jgi:hypothetical protein
MVPFKNYYNFIKIHPTLNTTPARASGLTETSTEGNRWLELIKLSCNQGPKGIPK